MKTAITPRWKQFSHPPRPDHPQSRDKFRSHSKTKENKPNLIIRTESSKCIPHPHVPLDPKRIKPKDKSKELESQYGRSKPQKKEGEINGKTNKEIHELKKQLDIISCQASQNEKALLSAAAMIADKYHFKLQLSQTNPKGISIKEIPLASDRVKEENSISSTQCSGKLQEGGSSKTVASSSDKWSHSSSKKDRITQYYFDFPSHP